MLSKLAHKTIIERFVAVVRFGGVSARAVRSHPHRSTLLDLRGIRRQEIGDDLQIERIPISTNGAPTWTKASLSWMPHSQASTIMSRRRAY
jgi:hypothetical protein